MKKSKSPLLGPDQRKLQPKLRMIANGSVVVNAMRAEHCSSVSVNFELNKKIKANRGEDAAPVKRSDLPPSVKRGSLKSLPDGVFTNVFVETKDASSGVPVKGESAQKGNLRTATLKVSELRKLAENNNVTYIELGEPLSAPTPDIDSKHTKAPSMSLRRFGSSNRHHNGRGVLIGIIDVEGFDFAHPDFIDRKGKTRFIRIWDQGGDARPAPSTKAPFNYGAEFTQEQLNNAIKNAGGAGVAAQYLERQSQMVESSHGTHVASVAAGNRGICRKAMIAGVLVSLPKEDQDRRQSFYDSTRIVHAVEYLADLADHFKVPLAINISLGTNGHAHDGTSAVSRWIDSILSVPGRCVVVSAGNSGQEVAEFEGDTGFVMGRIHTSGKISARDLNRDIEWLVLGNGTADVSENELEIWYGAQDRFAVSIRPPDSSWIGPVEPLEYIENREIRGGTFVSIYNELYHPSNGSNWISIYLSPFLSDRGVVGIPAGKWTIRLHAREVRDGRFHGWIERDDPRRLGRVGRKEVWRFPSFFSERSNVDDSSVGSLACGLRILSVANLDDAAERIHISSSQGPTRDGRSKPDVAAPGTRIAAANGFAAPGKQWIRMTGTSMASPFVTGIAGLMLAIEPKLSAAQIEGIMRRTASPLPGSDFNWLNDAGFGRIQPEACLNEAALVNKRIDKT